MKVILVDTGKFRPVSSNVFTVLMLDYLWSWVRLRERWNRGVPAPDEGYCVNLIVDEAAPIMQVSLVRDEMIPDAREFALAFELIVHFPEQVKRNALDTRAYKEILRNINTKLIGKLAIDDELATTLFHEEPGAIELSNRIASLFRDEWLAQLPDTGFMTDTPELVTLKPLPIPSGHSDGEDPVDAGTYSPDAGMTYQEVDELQWSRTRFSYCLVPGVNSPLSAAQRAARYETGPLNSEAIRSESPSDSLTIPTTVNSSHSDCERSSNTTERDSVAGSTIPGDDSADSRDDSSNEDRADGQVGGTSNEFGTVLGTGSAPRGPSPAPSDSTAGISDGSAVGPPTDDGRAAADASSGSPPVNAESYSLTPAEQQLRRDVIAGIDEELEGYDLTQSMTTIRNGVDGEIDEDRLVDMGYLELQSVNTRKYYYVTPAGQDAVDRTIYSGRNDGDPFEKTVHKVYVEYTAHHLRNQGLLVETYYEPMAGGMIFDVAAFLPGDGDRRTLAVIAEVVTNIRPDLMIKHYDDLASFDGVQKMWVVPHTDVAHEIIRVLTDAGRLQTVPHRDIVRMVRSSGLQDRQMLLQTVLESPIGFAGGSRESLPSDFISPNRVRGWLQNDTRVTQSSRSTMSTSTIKTIQATFAPATAHKQSKLDELLNTYRTALHAAFDAGASTISAVSDIVTPYDLPYQAKAALCNYVPKLRATYDAKELNDDHPIRFTNQAARFDHSDTRAYEFTWCVPRSGRRTNFWIPLRINSDQEPLWHDVVVENVHIGQIQLQKTRQNWVLHVPVEYPIEVSPMDDESTHIGLDIGETALDTGCALKDGSPTAPFVCDGRQARHLRKEMYTTLKRLQERDASE